MRRRCHRLATALCAVLSLLFSQLALANYACPAQADAAMAFSSVSVVTNALLLRRWHGAADAPPPPPPTARAETARTATARGATT